MKVLVMEWNEVECNGQHRKPVLGVCSMQSCNGGHEQDS
jgi:hypothetical protein